MRSLTAHRSFVLLLCLALMVRLAIPAGFMPDMAALAAGTLTMAPCPGVTDAAPAPAMPAGMDMAMSAMPADMAGMAHPVPHDAPAPHKPGKHHTVCPFAGGFLPLLPVLLLILALTLVGRERFHAAGTGFVFAGPLQAAYARGPPPLLT